MLRVRMESRELNKILNNTVSYSYGFLNGVDMNQITFNQRLGEFTESALGKYIDAKARMDPSALHHVYEWDQVGNEGARLFKLTSRASKRVIHIEGNFLRSGSVSGSSSEPFYDKAEVMENGISVTISPKNSGVLVFEDEGETVFTTNDIYVAHPGGDAVAGSFGRTVDEFFDVYFTNHLLKPFIAALAKPNAYARNFPAGTRGGAPVGNKASLEYLNSAGATLE